MTNHSNMTNTSDVELVILKPKSKSSARTRNRITEHGPSFFKIGEATVLTNSGSNLDGKECILVRSASHSRDWQGWLPLSEVHFLKSL